jgi:hypothetical protein
LPFSRDAEVGRRDRLERSVITRFAKQTTQNRMSRGSLQ